jgi:hypothetical protein
LKEFFHKVIVEWQPGFDNPDVPGWSVVTAYLLAAVCCGRAAMSRQGASREENRATAIWWVLALGLLVLGINKQLNLQTLLIILGRHASFASGWYGARRVAQVVFTGVLGLAGVGVLWFLRSRFRPFFARNRWAFIGLVVLLIFLLIRTASISHVLELAGFEADDEHGDKRWTWSLEIGGSACLGFAAIKARRRREVAVLA